jgi:N-acetyl sugar amidotransferase
LSKYPARVAIDGNRYRPSDNAPETFYGLPAGVEFCRSCVISNQRPNSAVEFSHTKDSKKQTIHFDDHGVCDACRFAERKTGIDWKQREQELRALCERYRRTDGAYDCIVAGSGGKDGFYAAHLLKNKYGMNPLTVTFSPHIYTDWGWRNFQSWMHAGFDNYLFTPNGRVHRLLTRLATENLFHPFQPFILGQKNFPARIAVDLGIPLVFYGENEAEYGNPKGDNESAKRNWRYFTSDDPTKIFLAGTSLDELQRNFGMHKVDFAPYMPVDPQRVERLGLEVHYMGYYERWHPQGAYYYAVEHSDFQAAPERTPGTYSKYNSIDDKMDDFFYYTTWIKFGIGRATYDAAQEIRSGDINRDEGVALVRRFDGEFPTRFLDELFRYLSIDEKSFPVASRQFEQPIMDLPYFENLADRFRSPHLWERTGGNWRLRHSVA